MYDWKMEIYWRLPVSLQEVGLSAYAWYLERIYYGRGYNEFKEWLQGVSFRELQEWRESQLRRIIHVAATKVPYYRRKWSGLNWQAVKKPEDLGILPTLHKQEIRGNERVFVREGLSPKSLWTEKTSGTTGTSLKIYWPYEMLPKWWAITEVMVRYVGGAAQEMPRAMVGGRAVVPGNARRPPYWRFNRRWRQLYLSSYHISRSTAPYYVEALWRYRPQWITGYGSAIAALAQAALDERLGTYPVRTVIVSGDTLFPGMRESIEKFFACKCFDSYGQCEGVSMAMECQFGRMHEIPVVGVTEILREDGTPCERGEVGEIVSTTLLNDAMPLVRYRTGDYAAWSTEEHCPCGNPAPILEKLEGRVDDYLLTADGRKIGRLSTAMKRSPTIHSAQIVQDRPGHAYLLVRPADGYQWKHAQAVKDDVLERIGDFELDVVEVPEIPSTPQGKTKLVVRLDEHPEWADVYRWLIKDHIVM